MTDAATDTEGSTINQRPYRRRGGSVMGRALDEYIVMLRAELRTGGGATLDELYNLALAIQQDMEDTTNG